MRFEDYIISSVSSSIENRSPSGWVDLSELSLPSGVLGIFDFAVLGNDNKAVIELIPGDYCLQVQMIDTGKHHYVSRLRVIAGDTGELGDQVADINIDCPQITLGDYQTFLNTTNMMEEEDEQEWFGHIDPHKPAGTTHLRFFTEDLQLSFVHPGFGDGIYPVYQLRHQGQLVGIEAVFMNELGQPPRAYASRFRQDFPAFATLLSTDKADPVQEMEPPAPVTEIEEVEREIGVPLPISYQRFLKLTAGVSLSCNSIVFGTSHLYFHEFEPFEHLSPHHQADLLHHDRRWPPPSEGFLCFADFWMEGEGDQALFDVKRGLIDGEYPVVYYNYERDAVSPLAVSFIDWLERVVSGAKSSTPS